MATVVYKYFEGTSGFSKDDVVLPELCLCLDVFNERLVPAQENPDKVIGEIQGLCDEIKLLWNKAAWFYEITSLMNGVGHCLAPS